MRERKKTAVHGTYMAIEFNFQQISLKALIPTMNTLRDMVVLNIIKTDGKCAPEAKCQLPVQASSVLFRSGGPLN